MIDFKELIDNYLQKEIYPRTIGRYWPSESGGCIRKNWYTFKIPKEVDKSTKRIFEAGNRIHDFISDVIQSEKNKHVQLIGRELPIKIKQPEYVISGRIDDLIMVLMDGKKYLIEVKSVKFLPSQARKEHQMQLQLYMHALEVHNGIMLYIKKDDLQTTQFMIDYNNEEFKEILSRFDKMHKNIINDNIPQAEAKVIEEKNWMCTFCPYAIECEKAGVQEGKVKMIDKDTKLFTSK